MLYIGTDGSIRLTRGDTARLQITIENTLTAAEYFVSEDDVLRLTIKRTVNDAEPLVQKEVRGSTVIHLEPSDTKSLAFGRYIYDVELTTADGDVYTVVEPTAFEVMKEVT